MRLFLMAFAFLFFSTSPLFAQDWSTKGGEARRTEIIRRFKVLLERTPSEGMAFKRLVSYVGKGKKLDKLIKEYEKKVEKNPKKANYRLILGHLLKSRNKFTEALEQYKEAVELEPKNALTWLSRGAIYVELRKMEGATKDFEKALSLEKNKDKKQEILRKLADTAFAQRDWKRATGYYDKLVALNPRSEYLRLEYAQILIQYKRFDKALDQYRALIKMAGRDAKTKATTMRDMGDLYEKIGNFEKALSTYRSAQKVMKKNHWLYRALEQRIVNVYRRTDKLNELIAVYEKRWRNPTYDQAMLLGDLYDEIGKEDAALKQYRKAIRKNPRQPDPRIKEIRILERRGDDKKVVKAYTKLVKVAPGEASYPFELVKVYFRSGNKKKALALLSKIEKRFRRSTDTYVLLADAYINYDLRKDALRIYKRLLRLEPRNDAFILALGEFYYQSGDTDKAVSIWVKLLKSDLDKGEAYARLGQVLGDHGLVDKGLDYFEKAVEIAPKDQNVRRGLALAYEHARRTDKAIAIWNYLLSNSDKSLIRNEARKRIINLYYKKNTLRKRMREYALEFAKGKSEAGFFLAAGHIKYSEYEEAEKILKELEGLGKKRGGEEGLKLEVTALNSLEKLHTRSGDLKKSIGVLERLAELLPIRKREYYQQIAEHSLKLFEDDKAVHYATLAVKANPDDATAQARLGRIYQKMGNLEGALVQFRHAVDIDPRAFDIQYQLAQILLIQKKYAEAEKLFVFIVKKAPASGVIARAGENAIELAELDGRLKELEGEFFPLVYRTPPKPIYKEMMLDIYEKMVSGIVDLERFGSAEEKKTASLELIEIGNRSLPVLVDALQTRGGNLRARSLRLITSMRPKGAALSINRLLDDPEDPLRPLAIIAAARIADSRSSAALSRAAKDKNSMVRFLSLWALGATGGNVAESALVSLLERNGKYEEQVLASIGLGRISSEGSKAALRTYLSANQGANNSASLATVWALGRAKDVRSLVHLEEALKSSYLSTLAAWSIAEIGGEKALEILLRSYWKGELHTRRASEKGLRKWFASQEVIDEKSRLNEEIENEIGLFDLRKKRFDSKSLTQRYRKQARRLSVNMDVQKFNASLDTIVGVAKELLKKDESTERVIATFACERGFGFGGIVSCGKSEKLAEQVHRLGALIRKHGSLKHPSTFLVLGELSQSGDFPTIVKALKSKDVRIRISGIQALGSFGMKGEPLLLEATKDSSPLIRSRAASSLSRMKATNAGIDKALVALIGDPYDSVRISAARTLGLLKSSSAVSALIGGLKNASRSVTIAFIGALSRIGGRATQSTLARYKAHADLRIRDAANGKDLAFRFP